jgi:predicted acylesterase/phospholipase RssA
MKNLKDLTIGVALSGGGFRATLHGLGALMFLVDSGLNKQVNCIASVSGGSVANGMVAARCDFRQVTPAQFDNVVRHIACEISSRGLIPSLPFYLYMSLIVLLAAMSLTALACTWLDYWPGFWSGLAFAGCLVLLFAAWLLRGHVLTSLLRRRIFSGRNMTLGEIKYLNIEHIFCATDINHGARVYFSTHRGGKIYSDSRGWGHAGHIPLCDAVRASSAYPGGFPPRRLSTRRCRFGKPAQARAGVPRGAVFYLADGGVWNNLASDWWDLKTDRTRGPGSSVYSTSEIMEPAPEVSGDSPHEQSTRLNGANLVLVLNSRASEFFLRPTPLLAFPFVAELVAMVRDMATMYENSVTPRLEALEELETAWLLDENRFPVLKAGDTVPPSAPLVVELNRNFKWSQLTVNSRLAKVPWLPARQEAFKHYNKDTWWERSRWNVVPTTFGALGGETVIQLMIDGYIGAMGALSVCLDVPLPENKPEQDRFRGLVDVNAGLARLAKAAREASRVGRSLT